MMGSAASAAAAPARKVHGVPAVRAIEDNMSAVLAENPMEEIMNTNSAMVITDPSRDDSNNSVASSSSSDDDDDIDDDDSDDDSSASSSDDDDDGTAVVKQKGDGNDNDDNNDGLSEYERLRLERIKRNEARLRELGLADLKPVAVPKTKHQQQQRRRQSNESSRDLGPARRQPKRDVKTKLTQEQLRNGGLDLRTLRLSSFSSDGNHHHHHRTNSQTGRFRCGTCIGCTREEDCETCVYCVDRQNGNFSRRCIFKACLSRSRKTTNDEGQDTSATATVAATDATMNIRKNTRSQKDSDAATVANTEAGENKRIDMVDQERSSNTIQSDQQCEHNSNSNNNNNIQSDQKCDVCDNGGDLIACEGTGCHRAYHSICHFPKIKKLPQLQEDVWLCMECNPRSKLPGGFLLARMPHTNNDHHQHYNNNNNGNGLVKVKVLEPVPQCTVCDQGCAQNIAVATTEQLQQESVHCRACDAYFHLGCHDPPLLAKPRGGGVRFWKCKPCRETNAPLLEKYVYHRSSSKSNNSTKTPRKQRPSDLKLFEGEHDDDCYICCNGGELVCCDFCPKVFHAKCHIPALPAIPTGIWKCCECYAIERKRMTRCGECKACLSADCGKCQFCLDKTKFGGNNSLKKPCVQRDCPYLSFAETFIPGRIPGEIGPAIPLSDKKRKPNKDKKRKRDSDANNYSNVQTKKAKIDKGNSASPEPEYEPVDDGDVIMMMTEDESSSIVKFKIPKSMDPVSRNIRKIINGAHRDAHDSKVQDKACEQLRKLAKSKENIDKIILSGGVEMISKAMSLHPEKTIVQAEACATVAEMAWIEPAIARKLAHVGVIRQVIETLSRLHTNTKVQQMGCGVLRALSYETHNLSFIDEVDGLSTVLNSMKWNPKKLPVLREGCYFLQNMLYQASDSTVDKIVDSHVVPIILDTLSNESADDDFKGSVLELIGNLALNKKAKTPVGEFAISSLVATLQNSLESPLKRAAFLALKHIAMDNSENQRKIAEAGVLPAIFTTIRAFLNEPLTLIAAFELMRELSLQNENFARSIVAEGGKTIILSSMKEHFNLTAMQVAACGLIAYLPFGTKDPVDLKIVSVILSALESHFQDVEVQMAGFEALLEIITHDIRARKLVHGRKIRELLLEAKKTEGAVASDVDDILAFCF